MSLYFTNFDFAEYLTRKFIKNELHVRIFQKAGQWLLQSGAALMYYNVGQMLLQTGAFFNYKAG